MEITNLIRTRGQIKGSFTKYKSYALAATESTTYEALKIRCDRLDSLWEEFVEIDTKISSYADQVSEYSSQEDIFLDLKERFLILLSTRSTPAALASSTGVEDLNTTLNRFTETQRSMLDHVRTNDTRLPKLDIPTFHGEYFKWPTFKDLFLNTVHNANTISKSRKFQYLQMYLKGEAETVISGMVCSNEAYDRAWSKVCDRYDKQKPIITSYIKSFFELKRVVEPSAVSIRTLADNTDCILRGLKSLGADAERRDPWIIYMLLKKVDDDTKRQWAESDNGSKDHPKIEEFIDFLNKRWSALECMQSYDSNNPTSRTRCFMTSEVNHTRCASCDGTHYLYKCPNFKAMGITQKREFVKNHNLCFNCLSGEHKVSNCPSKQKCHICARQHHSCLHLDVSRTRDAPDNQSALSTFSVQSSIVNQRVVLPTAVVNASNINGTRATVCKVLMDSASMGTFVSEDLVQRLSLSRRNGRVKVGGIGGAKPIFTKGIVSLRLTSRFNSNMSIIIEAFILNRISHQEKSDSVNISNCEFPKNLNMADDGSLSSHPIDVLIGSQYFFNFLSEGKYTSKTGFPTIQNTIFGYVLGGKVHNGVEDVCAYSVSISINDFKVDEALRRFWETENIPQEAEKRYTSEEQFCEEHFQQTHSYDDKGRHIVHLPFRDDSRNLGDTFNSAYRQFLNLEKRLAVDKSLCDQYKAFMEEYIAMGHMEKIPDSEISKSSNKTFYLPHHPVLKPDSRSTKCRVVFNGSSKSTSGVALNDLLAVGPTIQRDLTSLLLNFRRYRIGLSGDIVKMYRQVLVHHDDRDFQRILWRASNADPISHYRLRTITYGTAAAPFLATRCLHATGEETNSPQTGLLIKNNFYVDDFIAGANSVEEAIGLSDDVTNALARNSFPLSKWASNDPRVVQNIHAHISGVDISDIDTDSNLKILGLYWQPTTDSFTFKVRPVINACTKRVILSESSKIYDPLGFLSPCTVLIKIMFQQLWLSNIGWDEEISVALAQKWLAFRQHYECFNSLLIPRWVRINPTEKFQLCGFSDASEMAYAAAVYCRTTTPRDSKVFLLTAKTKVAPLKQISLPRLELAGALLLAKLLRAVKIAMELNDIECIAWTDSMIVLGWLSSHPRRWKTYVANRVAEINDIIPRSSWHHIVSQENPADVATRGLEPEALMKCSIWWHGPKWLAQPQHVWPHSIHKTADETSQIMAEERKNSCVALLATEQLDVINSLLNRYSTIHKVLSIIAAWNRVVQRKRDITNMFPTTSYNASEIYKALLHCVRWSQAQHYYEEMRQLSSGKPLSPKSCIAKLLPFIDSMNVLRVGGRLKNAQCNTDAKHPILISKDCILAQRIILSQHLKNLHAGPTLLMNILHQQFWITNCRRLIKQQINRCVVCTRYRAIMCSQQMSDLPASRVTQARPFLRTGIDYSGPLLMKAHKGRRAAVTKGYIAVFVCVATRAIHLEVVSDLTSTAFIAALKRFVSRRGLPSDIHSDNGTNFIGANRELANSFKQLSKSPDVGSYMAQSFINWHLIPPGAPHFGGIWESAVKSTKFHLRRVLGETKLTYEELATLLCEIEAQLNSRPLTAIYDDDTDNINVLTPGHFLIGQPLLQIAEPNLQHIQINRLSRWQLLVRIQQDFWRRWQREYLTTLQQRGKWYLERQNLQPGAVVLVYDERAPPSCWKMGLVTEVHPGKDKLIRVATVKTSHGSIKRPITKLCKLPTED